MTIIGGIIVYYVTSQKKEERAERLVYSVAPPVRFESSAAPFPIHSVTIGNEGNAPASAVECTVSFENGVKIQDYKASFSAGDSLSGTRIARDGDSTLRVNSPTLVPNEFVKLSILVQKPDIKPPRVTLRSATTLGVEANIVSPEEKPKKGKVEGLAKAIAGVASALQIIVGFFLGRKMASLFRDRPRSVNNVTFMYLHKGILDEAGEMLKWDIRKRGATSYELANYGLYLALKGRTEDAEKHFAAAEFYSSSSSVRGLVSMNRALMNIARGKTDDALQHFRQAIALSPKRMQEYASYSDLIADACDKEPRIRELFENLRAKRSTNRFSQLARRDD